MNLGTYTTEDTLQLVKMPTHSVTLHPFYWTCEISHSILTHTPKDLHHIQFSLYIFRKAPHFSTETHSNAIFPHKVRKRITLGTKKGTH